MPQAELGRLQNGSTGLGSAIEDEMAQTARSLTADEISSFNWRHPLVALDVALGTVSSTGETVTDDTLAGWVTVFVDNLGTEFILTNYDPGTDNVYSVVGSSVVSGVSDVASTVGNAVVSTVNYLPLILLGLGALFIFMNSSSRQK